MVTLSTEVIKLRSPAYGRRLQPARSTAPSLMQLLRHVYCRCKCSAGRSVLGWSVGRGPERSMSWRCPPVHPAQVGHVMLRTGSAATTGAGGAGPAPRGGRAALSAQGPCAAPRPARSPDWRPPTRGTPLPCAGGGPDVRAPPRCPVHEMPARLTNAKLSLAVHRTADEPARRAVRFAEHRTAASPRTAGCVLSLAAVRRTHGCRESPAPSTVDMPLLLYHNVACNTGNGRCGSVDGVGWVGWRGEGCQAITAAAGVREPSTCTSSSGSDPHCDRGSLPADRRGVQGVMPPQHADASRTRCRC